MMGEISPIGETSVVLPGTGELVDLTDRDACVKALDGLREHEQPIYDAKRALTRAIAAHSQNLGELTFRLDDGRKVEVTIRPDVTYDAVAIEEQLREAGAPEELIRRVVKEEVTWKVVAVEAKKAARANDVYAQIIEANRTEIPKAPSVTIRRT